MSYKYKSYLVKNKNYIKNLNKRNQKKKWNFKNSIYKDWKKVTEEFVQNCFEFDWSNNKIYRIIKNTNDLQNVRNHFK